MTRHDYRLPANCEDWEEFTELEDEETARWLTEERCRMQANRQMDADLDETLRRWDQQIVNKLQRAGRRLIARGWHDLSEWR